MLKIYSYYHLFLTPCMYQLHERNDEMSHTVHEERNILNKINKRKAKWIGHILRRNCLLKQAVEGKIEGRSDGKTMKKT